MSHIPPISMKVQATLAAYRGVTCLTSTADTAKYPASAAERPIGVTADTVLDITAAIPVITEGLARLDFNNSVASGALVALDSTGLGVAHADVTAGSWYVGTLIGPSASTGTSRQVYVQPGFKSIP
jgi:hypothetical protein